MGIVSPLAQALTVAMALTLSRIAHGCGMERISSCGALLCGKIIEK